LESFSGKTLSVRVIEIDRKRRKVVFSHKMAVVAGQRTASSQLWDELEAGQVLKGTVSSVKKFGAFVELGNGVEGLVHISELSWKKVADASSVVKPGDMVDVFVLGVDKDQRRISLGMKQLQPDPWASAEDKFKPGQLVTGVVTRLAGFGAFVELAGGLEGLIHLSELSDKKINKPDDVVHPGDHLQVRVLRVNSAEQRIGLSLKEAMLQADEGQPSLYQSQAEGSKDVTIGDIMNPNGSPA
jgi:ribosomal protein S1